MNARGIAAVLIAALIGAWGAGSAAAQGFAGLGEDAAGFAEVVPGTPLSFPEDHGPHPAFRIEWWYVTANLKDRAGTPYGVQWTLFRQALSPGPEREGWGNQQVWMGHAAVTSGGAHLFAETLARGGIGQAGAEARPFHAWIDDWSFASDGVEAAAGLGAATLSAEGAGFSYTLRLTTETAPVLQGDHGYSRKSERGQASYYYSQPFFEVAGTLMIGGQAIEVTGSAWMDREWSSQPLASDQKGWDWLSLHLPEGEKLMLFRLRSDTEGAFLSGNWISADGRVTPLEGRDIALTPLRTHTVAGRSVPVAWSVEVKSHGFKVETSPLNPESWMATAFPYWEGPIRFAGSHTGVGYLEMTGY